LQDIGKPVSQDFVPDDFQLQAIAAIAKSDCFVIAPTGAGKTFIAEEAISRVLANGGRCWYTSPLKALTNAKWVEFRNRFGDANVGILTGDIKENTQAPLVTGTTEILRNCLYDAMTEGGNIDFDLVVIDEAHYLGDGGRGVVWEETLMYLPCRINILLLSATIGNGEQIVAWLKALRGKECALIIDATRPVPLFPLFYHPRRHLLTPLLGKDGNTFDIAKEYSLARRKYPARPLGVTSLVTALRKHNLLPAIFFVKSRQLCDYALEKAASVGGAADTRHDRNFNESIDRLLTAYPYLRNHKHLRFLRENRLASHHGGHLPLWKFCVETMMKEGHLEAIFATTTVAAGVNFPARSVVITDSDLFDGDSFNPLTSTEFLQMSGRAGRRGIDKIGFIVTAPGAFMDVEHIAKLITAPPQNINSQIRNNFSMCLNLLKSRHIDDIRNIFRDSFAAFQKKSVKENLWQDFLRHLDFLRAEGFVDGDNRLTSKGEFASKMRVDEPLLFAQALVENVFSRADEATLAALTAAYAFDGDEDIAFTIKNVPRRLKSLFRHSEMALYSIQEKLRKEGFPTAKRFLGIAYAIYLWASGSDWRDLIKTTGIAEGDMVSLILRTAEHLRQISSIDAFPEVTAKALRARKALLREPAAFDI